MKAHSKGTPKALCTVHNCTILTYNPSFSQYNKQVQDFGKRILGAVRMFYLAYNHSQRIVLTATLPLQKRFLFRPMKNDLSCAGVCSTIPNSHCLMNASSIVPQCRPYCRCSKQSSSSACSIYLTAYKLPIEVLSWACVSYER